MSPFQSSSICQSFQSLFPSLLATRIQRQFSPWGGLRTPCRGKTTSPLSCELAVICAASETWRCSEKWRPSCFGAPPRPGGKIKSPPPFSSSSSSFLASLQIEPSVVRSRRWLSSASPKFPGSSSLFVQGRKRLTCSSQAGSPPSPLAPLLPNPAPTGSYQQRSALRPACEAALKLTAVFVLTFVRGSILSSNFKSQFFLLL